MLYDIIIVGGGIAGATAAISAAMTGVKVLLIERYGYLGGTLTAGGVAPMMTFHAGETQVVQGVPEKIIRRMVENGLSPGHIFDTTGYTYTVTPFDLEGLKITLEDMIYENGGSILYNTVLVKSYTQNGRITGIDVSNKAGITHLEAKLYIDASGDADLAAWSGVDFTVGRETDGKTQALTMMLRVNNVDMAATREYIHNHSEEFPRLEGDTYKIDKASRLSIGGFVKTLAKAKEDGFVTCPCEDVLFFETNNPGEVNINMSRLFDINPLDPEALSCGESYGRKQAWELLTFFRRFVPGFSEARMMFTGPSVGVRSSRQIKGIYTLTEEDIRTCRIFEDAVAYSGYPVDVHAPHDEEHLKRQKEHMEENKRAWGKIRSIPYRCLINPVISNLITVGRCVSVSFRAQGAFRTAPIAAAIGHAGGAAAALAVKNDCTATQVDLASLRTLLSEQDAFLL